MPAKPPRAYRSFVDSRALNDERVDITSRPAQGMRARALQHFRATQAPARSRDIHGRRRLPYRWHELSHRRFSPPGRAAGATRPRNAAAIFMTATPFCRRAPCADDADNVAARCTALASRARCRGVDIAAAAVPRPSSSAKLAPPLEPPVHFGTKSRIAHVIARGVDRQAASAIDVDENVRQLLSRICFRAAKICKICAYKELLELGADSFLRFHAIPAAATAPAAADIE